jgi:hypothetical protein
MKKCNKCGIECTKSESIAMTLVKHQKKRIFILSTIAIIELAIILGLIAGTCCFFNSMVIVSCDYNSMLDETDVKPFETMEFENTITTSNKRVKRKIIAVKKR